jgi:hypothetical protein
MARIAAGFVMLLIICGNMIYFCRSTAPAIVFDPGLSKIAVADTDDSVKAVYIDVSGYSQRMAAAIFVNHKRIFFGGPTGYGPETKPQDLPNGNIAVFRESCSSQDAAPIYEVVNHPASQVKIRQIAISSNVSFAGSNIKCLHISGFSGGEAWGRWTDGNSASIHANCMCDLSKQKAQMVLSAGTFLIPGKVERQRAIFRVNGSAPQERVLDSMDKKDIVLDLPTATDDHSLIDVKIELPDAASPSESGSTDTRKLGLSIAYLRLIDRP